jgi:hypothetical protein
MLEMVSAQELRAQLNPILGSLPPAARQVARDRIEAARLTQDLLASPTDGHDRAILANVGAGFTALREADCDLLNDIVRMGLKLLAKGPDLEVVGELVALLFTIRTRGVALTTEQGLVLRVLRETRLPLDAREIGDALAATRLGLTDAEVTTALAGLEASLNTPGRAPTVICEAGKWRAQGV